MIQRHDDVVHCIISKNARLWLAYQEMHHCISRTLKMQHSLEVAHGGKVKCVHVYKGTESEVSTGLVLPKKRRLAGTQV